MTTLSPTLSPTRPLDKRETSSISGERRFMLHGTAKAITPFGPVAGQTAISITDFGTDSALIEFMCGSTPVMLAVADSHYLSFVQALISHASPAHRAQLEADLHAALEEGVA